MPKKYLFYRMLCICITFFFYSKNSYGQRGYVPGYIISPTNDTIQTRIKISDLKINQCTYIDRSGTSCTGTPETVEKFAVSNGRKFRYIKFENKENPFETYFEVLVEGKINLFTYQGRYFVQKGNSAVIELLNTKDERTLYVRNKKEYIGVLLFLLSDATTSMPDVTKINLDRDIIVKIIRIYNEGEPYIQELKQLEYKPNFKFGFEALFARDSYRFRFPSIYTNVDEYNNHFFVPGVGGAVKYQFSKYLLLSSGVRLKYLDYSLYQSYSFDFLKRFYTLKNNFVILSVPIILDCQFDNLSFHPFVGVGLQLEKSFMKNTICLMETNVSSVSDYSTYELRTNFSNLFNTYWTVELGGGKPIGKHYYSIKIQYLNGVSILNTNNSSQFFHESGLQLIFGVVF
jgi:hypothetical protein